VKLVEQHGCALLAVRHLDKAKLGRTLYAGQGSIDFTAPARSVLLAGSAAEDADAHALIHIKSNLAPHGPALAYHLLPAFLWQGPSRLTANDLLAAAAPADEASAEDDKPGVSAPLPAWPTAGSGLFEARRLGGSELPARCFLDRIFGPGRAIVVAVESLVEVPGRTLCFRGPLRLGPKHIAPGCYQQSTS
jgi:hypothetical protein